jgi:hypothetical protein
LPGQRTCSGERTPPSSVLPLWPFIPPFHRGPLGPLSLKYTTMVFRSSFFSFSAASSRPTLSSMFSHIASAARVWSRSSLLPPVSFSFAFSKRRQYFSGTCIGECGVLYAR